jgi:hypothetical protein
MERQSLCKTCFRWRHWTTGGVACVCDGRALLGDLNDAMAALHNIKLVYQQWEAAVVADKPHWQLATAVRDALRKTRI